MILGLGHQAQSGKSTIAAYLRAAYGFKERALADALKAACREIFGFTEDQLYGSGKYQADPYWEHSPGWFLQRVGTELFRDRLDNDIWVKALTRHIATDPEADWVVPDVRFENEARALLERGAVLVRVVRPAELREPDGRDLNHVSELALASWDGWSETIVNDGTFEDLYGKVDGLVDSLRSVSALSQVAIR